MLFTDDEETVFFLRFTGEPAMLVPAYNLVRVLQMYHDEYGYDKCVFSLSSNILYEVHRDGYCTEIQWDAVEGDDDDMRLSRRIWVSVALGTRMEGTYQDLLGYVEERVGRAPRVAYAEPFEPDNLAHVVLLAGEDA